MASLSEEVLLVVKKVRQRKQDGTLYLMAERIAWGPEGKDRFTVSHLYADIRCEQLQSPQTHLKPIQRCVRGPIAEPHFVLPAQVKRSAQMAKPKSSSSWSSTLARAPHSTFPTRAARSETERPPKSCCSSFCPSLRRRPTRNWRRRTGEALGRLHFRGNCIKILGSFSCALHCTSFWFSHLFCLTLFAGCSRKILFSSSCTRTL